MLNSDRFLNAFNSIERSLRMLANKEKGDRFYALVDTASEDSSIVRRFSNDLKEFADLRNAIVHERTDGHVLAEPNDQAVGTIEFVASLLLDPPKVIPFFQSDVTTLSVGDPIAKAVKTMFEQSFSQMPVYDGATCVGLLTADTVARWLGASVAEDIFSLSETPVSAVLGYTEDKDNYSVIGRDSTLFEVLERFQISEIAGKRLEAILITQNGKLSEALLGIVTIWDLPKIHEALEKPKKGPPTTR